jgi:glutamine synthetase
LFALPLAAIRERGIALLPQSLDAAIDALEASTLMRQTLGETLHREFLRLKRDEWLGYARHVSGWELARYAALF